MKFKSFLSLAIIALPFGVQAEKTAVDSAFGLTLGERIEARLVQKCNEDVANGPIIYCAVNPDHKLPFFTNYFVGLDNSENRIVHIEAFNSMTEDCAKSKEALGKALDAQYEKFQGQDFLWGPGDKIARLDCTKSESLYRLSLKFTDAHKVEALQNTDVAKNNS